MKGKFNIEAYRRQVQENFSGADGWDNAYGNPAMNFAGADAMPSNGMDDMPSAPQINFTIVNSNTTTTKTAVLFGANINLSSEVSNYGSQTGITITPDYSITYAQVLQDTAAAPFTIGMVRMQSSNTSQVTQGLTVISTNIYGESKSQPINMVTAVSEYQQQLTIARSTVPFDITGNVYFSFPVLASTTVTCTVYIKSKVNVARQLNGAAIAGDYSAPNTGIKPVMIGSRGQLDRLG